MSMFDSINRMFHLLQTWFPIPELPQSVIYISNPPYGMAGTHGVFSFLALTTRANGNITVPVNRTSGSAGAVGVDVVAVDETAVRNTDYFVDATTALSWADVESASKSVSIRIVPSLTQKTFKLRLQNPTGGATVDGTYNEITITIPALAYGVGGCITWLLNYYIGDPSHAQMDFAESSTFLFPPHRGGGNSGAVTVDWHTEDGTAVAGVDYVAANGTCSWPDTIAGFNQNAGPITINAAASDGKYFYVVLDNPTGGATVGLPSCSELRLVIKKTAVSPGSLEFKVPSVQAPESAAYTFTVKRLGGSTGAVSVNYACTDMTAANGVDYTAASGTLNWADGDAADKTFNITMLAVSSSNKYFKITLSAPGGGATLGTYSVCSCYIQNAAEIPDPAPLTDTIEGDALGFAVETLEGVYFYRKNIESHVVVGQALLGTVIGFNGGTGSFGSGSDLMSDDETLEASSPLRFIASEM